MLSPDAFEVQTYKNIIITILIFRLLLHIRHMYVASIRLDFTKNEWNAPNSIWSHVFGPSITHNLITRVFTIFHSTVMEQKRFDLWLLLPALHNLWLLLVNIEIILVLSILKPSCPYSIVVYVQWEPSGILSGCDVDDISIVKQLYLNCIRDCFCSWAELSFDTVST